MLVRAILLIGLLIIGAACTKPADPAKTAGNNQNNQQPAGTGAPTATTVDPTLLEVYKQADKVKQRLRFYGEEIKTTYKPEKQAGLFANVRATIHPVWQEINNIITTKNLTNSSAVRVEKACAALDKVFEFGSVTANVKSVNFEEVKAALQEFNEAFAELERAAGMEKKPEEKK